MKKILNITFLILVIISFKNVSALEQDKSITNNNNIVISEEKFLELMDAGYTIDEIYNMNQEEYNNADTNNEDIALGTKYLKTISTTRYGTTTNETYEITEEDYLNGNDDQISTFGTSIVETTYKKLTAMITSSDLGDEYKFYKAYMYWKTMPSVRSYDIIGMGFQSNLVNITYGIDFRNLYTYNGTTYVDTSCITKESTNGGGAVFPLPTNSIVTLCQEISFNVEKNNASSTITSLEAAGDYAHATQSVSYTTVNNNYHTSATGGLVLYSAISNKYDSMSAAHVYWDGTW